METMNGHKLNGKRQIVLTLIAAVMLPAFGCKKTVTNSGLPPQEKIAWPAFMQQHDMTFDKLPSGWTQAPHFGNAMVGSMLYQAGDTIRLQVFRADVHDHRDDTYGWTAYSRPRLMIGHFSLHPVGKLTGCSWRKDLWNAELTGTIKTDIGEIRIRHFTHADDMAIVTELTAVSPVRRDVTGPGIRQKPGQRVAGIRPKRRRSPNSPKDTASTTLKT